MHVELYVVGQLVNTVFLHHSFGWRHLFNISTMISFAMANNKSRMLLMYCVEAQVTQWNAL